MNKDKEIRSIGISTSNFIRSRIRRLDLSDDEKLRMVMNATAFTSAIFIDALAQLNAVPRSHLVRDYTQTIEEILHQLNHIGKQ